MQSLHTWQSVTYQRTILLLAKEHGLNYQYSFNHQIKQDLFYYKYVEPLWSILKIYFIYENVEILK